MGVVGETDGRAGPFLVVPELKEGQFLYRIAVESVDSEAETTLEARPFPCPAAHFPSRLGCQAFAVCGGHIMGLRPNSRDTFIYDDAARAVAPGPQLRDPKIRPALLPVGDDAVLVLDLFTSRTPPLFAIGGYTFSPFEALRRLPGGQGWRAAPLPDPPVEYGAMLVTAYLTRGGRAWVSVRGGGTFSVDVREEGAEWRVEGSWEVPFRGRAFHAPELGAGVVVGFGAVGLPYLRAVDVDNINVMGRPQPTPVGPWNDTATYPFTEYKLSHPQEDSLAYLGEGRFCIARHVRVSEEEEEERYAIAAMATELRRPPGGGALELAKCGKLRLLAQWPRQEYPSPYLIHPGHA